MARVLPDRRLAPLAPVLLYRTLGSAGRSAAGRGAVRPGAARGDGARPVAGARRLRRLSAGGGRRAVLRHPGQPVRRRVRRRRLGRGARPRRARRTARSTWRCPTCSPRSTSCCAGSTSRATRRSRSCCPPASAGRSPPTRSSATRPGARRTPDGALRINPDDAAALGVASGEAVRITTAPRLSSSSRSRSRPRCSAATSLCPTASASATRATTAQAVTGVAPNELTSTEDRDPFVGTPWHKHVPGPPRARAARTRPAMPRWRASSSSKSEKS